MSQSTIKISSESQDLVKEIKKVTGIPMARFIDEAIELKASKLPKHIKQKIAALNGK